MHHLAEMKFPDSMIRSVVVVAPAVAAVAAMAVVAAVMVAVVTALNTPTTVEMAAAQVVAVARHEAA